MTCEIGVFQILWLFEDFCRSPIKQSAKLQQVRFWIQAKHNLIIIITQYLKHNHIFLYNLIQKSLLSMPPKAPKVTAMSAIYSHARAHWVGKGLKDPIVQQEIADMHPDMTIEERKRLVKYLSALKSQQGSPEGSDIDSDKASQTSKKSAKSVKSTKSAILPPKEEEKEESILQKRKLRSSSRVSSQSFGKRGKLTIGELKKAFPPSETESEEDVPLLAPAPIKPPSPIPIKEPAPVPSKVPTPIPSKVPTPVSSKPATRPATPFGEEEKEPARVLVPAKLVRQVTVETCAPKATMPLVMTPAPQVPAIPGTPDNEMLLGGQVKAIKDSITTNGAPCLNFSVSASPFSGIEKESILYDITLLKKEVNKLKCQKLSNKVTSSLAGQAHERTYAILATLRDEFGKLADVLDTAPILTEPLDKDGKPVPMVMLPVDVAVQVRNVSERARIIMQMDEQGKIKRF